MESITSLFTILELMAALSSGIYAGALLTEACILVPFWQRMNPENFLSMHHQMGPSLFRFYAPVTIAGTVLPIIAYTAAYMNDSQSALYWAVCAVIALFMLGIYFAYFKSANESFKTGSIDVKHLNAELSRWAFLHKLRTSLAITGLFAALLAISSTQT